LEEEVEKLKALLSDTGKIHNLNEVLTQKE